MTLYWQDENVTLHHGDALSVLRDLPSASVDCLVTSPPYFALRDYGVVGQIGAEQTPAEYVADLCAVFSEARRVLADDATFWLNIGDSYYSGRGNPGPNSGDEKNPARRGWVRPVDRPGADWAKPKNLLGIPWRVAFALQDDGWILRNDIAWIKGNAMPESVQDRLSSTYEHVFLFSKSRRYWFDLDPIRAPLARIDQPRPIGGRNLTPRHVAATDNTGWKDHLAAANPAGRNPGDSWQINTVPFPGAHFATFPPELPRRCILAGCKPGGTVLDPFHGSGTTGMVAQKLGRKYVGIELNRDYLDLSLRTRLANGALNFEEPA